MSKILYKYKGDYFMDKPRGTVVSKIIQEDDKTIAICKNKSIILTIIIIILLIILLLLLLRGCSHSVSSKEAGNIEVELDPSAKDWDGVEHTNGGNSDESQEVIAFPGFATVTASASKPLLQLYNYPENTVNFIYTVVEQLKDTEVKVQEFATLEEAYLYISANQVLYSNYSEDISKGYLVKDQNGTLTNTMTEMLIKEEDGVYVVYIADYRVHYFTGEIGPGKSVDWNIYESLGSGSRDLQIRISSVDIKTSVASTGVINPTKYLGLE